MSRLNFERVSDVVAQEHEGALVHERTDIVAHIFRLEELLEQCKETVPHDEHWDILQNDLDNFASTVTSVWTVRILASLGGFVASFG